jgi:hypothetical protein
VAMHRGPLVIAGVVRRSSTSPGWTTGAAGSPSCSAVPRRCSRCGPVSSTSTSASPDPVPRARRKRSRCARSSPSRARPRGPGRRESQRRTRRVAHRRPCRDALRRSPGHRHRARRARASHARRRAALDRRWHVHLRLGRRPARLNRGRSYLEPSTAAAPGRPIGQARHSRGPRQRRYSCGRHLAHGRYPAAFAVAASAKNTRCLTWRRGGRLRGRRGAQRTPSNRAVRLRVDTGSGRTAARLPELQGAQQGLRPRGRPARRRRPDVRDAGQDLHARRGHLPTQYGAATGTRTRSPARRGDASRKPPGPCARMRAAAPAGCARMLPCSRAASARSTSRRHREWPHLPQPDGA